MSWLIPITTPGPASYYATRSFSEHIYVYEEELLSGHSIYYLGSPHLDMLPETEHLRAIYRAQSIISIFNSIQRLSYNFLWDYDTSYIVFNDRTFNLLLKDENIALEELADPFKDKHIQSRGYKNQLHDYLHLATVDYLVHNVLLLLNDAYNYTQFFYINLYKIVETIQNDWRPGTMNQYSPDSKIAYDFLTSSNIKGYMNQFIASGLYSRHGYAGSRPAAPSVLNPPPVKDIKEQMLCLINGWLNYKLNPTQITYSVKDM